MLVHSGRAQAHLLFSSGVRGSIPHPFFLFEGGPAHAMRERFCLGLLNRTARQISFIHRIEPVFDSFHGN